MKAIHSSDYLFDWPDYNKQEENRNGHINGRLGLWVTRADHSSIFNYGRYHYEIEVDMSNSFPLTLTRLYTLNTEKKILAFRLKILSLKYQVANIIEKDGQIVISVVLDYAAIKSFRRIDV